MTTLAPEPEAPLASAKPARPLPIAIVAILSFAAGALLLFPLLAIAAALVAQGRVGFGLAAALFPQALLAGALGLWFMRRWGLYTVLVALAMFGFVAFENILSRPRTVAALALPILAFLATVALFGYLSSPRVRDLLR